MADASSSAAAPPAAACAVPTAAEEVCGACGPPAAAAGEVVCGVCGRKGHTECGQGFWEKQRAQWIQRGRQQQEEDAAAAAAEDEDEEGAGAAGAAGGAGSDGDTPSAATAGSRTPRPSWGSAASAAPQPLSDQDRVNLRAVLVSTESPYPRLRRPYSLDQAVRTAHQLWEDGSAADDNPTLARLAEAARTIPHEVVEKTMSLGTNLARWSQGLWGSAASALASASSGMASAQPTPRGGGEENRDSDLRNSLRNRGGLRLSTGSGSSSVAAAFGGALGGGGTGSAGLDRRTASTSTEATAAPTPRAKSMCCGE